MIMRLEIQKTLDYEMIYLKFLLTLLEALAFYIFNSEFSVFLVDIKISSPSHVSVLVLNIS